MTAKKAGDNTAAIAAQFGISLKALRLYEKLGMLKPPRSEAGWRAYGPAEIERVQAILALKQLGLPLARIAELLRNGAADMTALLDIHQTLLEENLRETQHALRLTCIAKERLRDGKPLSIAEFAEVMRKVGLVIRWSPELEQLAERVYTPEQIAKVHDSSNDPAETARASVFWDEINIQIDRLLPGGDPCSEEALAIGRRIVNFIRQFTRGDKELWNNAGRFWQAALDDPQTADQIPVDRPHHEFVGQILKALQARGELIP